MGEKVQEIKTTLIVTYKRGIPTEAFKEAKKGLTFKKEEKLKFVEQDILTFDTEEEATAVKAKLEKRKNVESVVFDNVGGFYPTGYTNDFSASTFNYHMTANPNIPNDNFDWLKLKHINDNKESKSDVILAIIDDGVNINHPDLTGKFVDGYNAHQDKLQSVGGVINIPNQSHGTMVTGMAIAKTNNGIGGASVGGIFDNVKVLPIAVYEPTGVESPGLSSFSRAFNHAIARGADVVNMSWGGYGFLNLESSFEAVYNAGIAFFTGSGNDGRNNAITPSYPTNFPTVIPIGSVGKNMELSVFSAFQSSNYGKNMFVGNGGNIIKLTLANSSVGTNTDGGTSSASPHVAGIYAAMKAVNPSLTREKIISIMTYTAYLKDGNKFLYGRGYPNAVEAIRLARIRGSEFTWGTATIVPLNKVWNVSFNGNVDASKLGGVYVIDAYEAIEQNTTGKEHPVTVTASGSTITITPQVNYKPNGVYALVLSDLYNTNGTKIISNVVQPFITD